MSKEQPSPLEAAVNKFREETGEAGAAKRPKKTVKKQENKEQEPGEKPPETLREAVDRFNEKMKEKERAAKQPEEEHKLEGQRGEEERKLPKKQKEAEEKFEEWMCDIDWSKSSEELADEAIKEAKLAGFTHVGVRTEIHQPHWRGVDPLHRQKPPGLGIINEDIKWLVLPREKSGTIPEPYCYPIDDAKARRLLVKEFRSCKGI